MDSEGAPPGTAGARGASTGVAFRHESGYAHILLTIAHKFAAKAAEATTILHEYTAKAVVATTV